MHNFQYEFLLQVPLTIDGCNKKNYHIVYSKVILNGIFFVRPKTMHYVSHDFESKGAIFTVMEYMCHIWQTWTTRPMRTDTTYCLGLASPLEHMKLHSFLGLFFCCLVFFFRLGLYNVICNVFVVLSSVTFP